MASDEPLITGTSALAAEEPPPELDPWAGACTSATDAVERPCLVPSLPVSAVAASGDPTHLRLVRHNHNWLPENMAIIALNLSAVQCPRFNMAPPSPVQVAALQAASLKWDFADRVDRALRYAEFLVITMDHIQNSFVEGLLVSLVLHHTMLRAIRFVRICLVWCAFV